MSDAIELQQRPVPRLDASAQRVARVYAESLLAEAKKHGQLREVYDELCALRDQVAGADPLIAQFFLGGLVGRDNRERVLLRAFEGRCSDVLLNFLLVLNRHDRMDLLGAIIQGYRDLLDVQEGKVRVVVKTAVPLPADLRERLLVEMRQATRREPDLIETVDPDLLGGLVVQVGDLLYDASVRTQLDHIRNQLTERSSHEIQAGRDRFCTDDGN